MVVSTGVHTYSERKGKVWRTHCCKIQMSSTKMIQRKRELYNDTDIHMRGYGLVNTAVWTS